MRKYLSFTISLALSLSVFTTAFSQAAQPTAPSLMGSVLSNTSAMLNWTPSSGGSGFIGGYTIYRDDVLVGLVSASSPLTYTDSGLVSNFTYKYEIRAYDSSFIFSNLSNAVILTPGAPAAVDTVSPTVSISAPANNSTYTTAQNVSISGLATDNVGITKVEFLENGNVISTQTVAPFSYLWPVDISMNGPHNLTMKAWDAAGNMGESSSRTIVVNIPNPRDTISPTVTISTPANNSLYTSAQDIVISGTASDNVGLTKVEFFEGANRLGEDTTSPYSLTWSLIPSLNGKHNIKMKAWDAEGNSGDSLVRVITVAIPIGGDLFGWAWSSNVGWLNFNCSQPDSSACSSSNFKASVSKEGNIAGWVWSRNIGWIKLGGLGGNGKTDAKVILDLADANAGQVTGWIRACAGTTPPTASGDCSSSTSRDDGWDGWIQLSESGSTYSSPSSDGRKGVTMLTDERNKGHFVGSAWGGAVVGWINFAPELPYGADPSGRDLTYGVRCPDCVPDQPPPNKPVSAKCLVETKGVFTSSGGTKSIARDVASAGFGSGGPYSFRWGWLKKGETTPQMNTVWKPARTSEPETNVADSIDFPRNAKTDKTTDIYTVVFQARDASGEAMNEYVSCGSVTVDYPTSVVTNPGPTEGNGQTNPVPPPCTPGTICGGDLSTSPEIYLHISDENGDEDDTKKYLYLSLLRGKTFRLHWNVPNAVRCDQYIYDAKGSLIDTIPDWRRFDLSYINTPETRDNGVEYVTGLTTLKSNNVLSNDYKFTIECTDASKADLKIDDPEPVVRNGGAPPKVWPYAKLHLRTSGQIEI